VTLRALRARLGARDVMQPPLPYRSEYVTQTEDVSQLRLLSIFHYVYAGLLFFSGFFALIYVAMGIFFAADARELEPGNPAAPATVGALFAAIGLLVMLIVWVKAALLVWAGRSLAARTRYTLCFIVACVSCIAFPMGTILGVFTLIVLNRPNVKSLFAPAV
jgi:hypothetical protein